jgi:ATP/ADP translocase
MCTRRSQESEIALGRMKIREANGMLLTSDYILFLFWFVLLAGMALVGDTTIESG